VLGWTEAELCAVPFLDFVHPEDRQSTLDAAQTLVSLGVDFQGISTSSTLQAGIAAALGKPTRTVIHRAHNGHTPALRRP
jgi:hypothetical protein